MPTLGVNIDHIATLRQARRSTDPDPVMAAVIIELAGADGITVHLREDRRHIQDRDVRLLRQTVRTRLNLEMAATPEMVAIALDVRPDYVTLVPEKREELTTEGGLDILKRGVRLSKIVAELQGANIPASLFIEPDDEQIRAAASTGAQFIELHTGTYGSTQTEAEQNHELGILKRCAELALSLGLRLNAGHGLNYRNTRPIVEIPGMEELNIGHSIVSRAILVGLDRAVRDMKAITTL
ncbi:MAG: pyridoxine 5'-phosphate synthase [Pseudanabaena sp. ELA607]